MASGLEPPTRQHRPRLCDHTPSEDIKRTSSSHSVRSNKPFFHINLWENIRLFSYRSTYSLDIEVSTNASSPIRQNSGPRNLQASAKVSNDDFPHLQTLKGFFLKN
ncbi:hypothetical protein TNCV_2880791 [Trichonephila clavipes]|nr:hypothetical protein TNCV_2880791 [Trichonephila clavipes]